MAEIIGKFNQALWKLGVLTEETENNNQNNPKWTLTAMERYMRDQSQSSIDLGLISHPPLPAVNNNKRRPTPVQSQGQHLVPILQNGDNVLESGGEESSPSWASSSAGNTPSYGSSGVAFEFNSSSRTADDPFDKTTPTITTTTCTPKSTPENNPAKKIMPLSLSTDLLSALDCDLEVSSKPRKSRKDSQSSVKSEDSHRGTPTKTSKLRRLLRRTRSAGCSKDANGSEGQQFIKEKEPVTKTKSADSAPCSREEGGELKKSSRKTLAQDMKMRLSFLRRRHTDSSLQPSIRPSAEEAQKWAESFEELTNSKYGLTLFRAFLAREFCEENIDFWLACEEYKRTTRPNKLVARAKKIYDDYLAVQAPKEVNLDSSMRTIIQDRLQNPDRHSFDPAQRRIQGLMEQDAYTRFLDSDLYKDLTQVPNTSS